jgi:predicted N-acetyltransferase YhbS
MKPFDIISSSPDAASLTRLLDLCFGPGRHARTAERLREGNRAMADYDFCAQSADGMLLGSISFWPIYIGQSPALLLGPLAVHP